jgi:hypothetical protein
MKKRATKKDKNQVTGVAAKILLDKGDKWVKNICGTTNPTTVSQVADLVYFHYLESDKGKEVCDSPGQNEGKVDYIFDSIHDEYIYDLEWITKDEWMAISDELYSMVYEGVF